jgi:hypothetical protein
MSKSKGTSTTLNSKSDTKKKRAGIHSKKKSCKGKKSKNYKKVYRGQGR